MTWLITSFVIIMVAGFNLCVQILYLVEGHFWLLPVGTIVLCLGAISLSLFNIMSLIRSGV